MEETAAQQTVPGMQRRQTGKCFRTEKVLSEFVIMSGSVLEGKKVSEITWPKNCLLVAVERDGKGADPHGAERGSWQGIS